LGSTYTGGNFEKNDADTCKNIKVKTKQKNFKHIPELRSDFNFLR